MKPKPTNDNQIRIAAGIDTKAAVLAEAGSQWNGNEIRNGMGVATRYDWAEPDYAFFDRYLRWRSCQDRDI